MSEGKDKVKELLKNEHYAVAKIKGPHYMLAVKINEVWYGADHQKNNDPYRKGKAPLLDYDILEGFYILKKYIN